MWGGRREAAAVHERRVSEIKKSVYQRRRRIAPQSAAPFPWRSCGPICRSAEAVPAKHRCDRSAPDGGTPAPVRWLPIGLLIRPL
jgi:hypothetical protein